MLFRMVLTACKYIINKSLQVMSFKTMKKAPSARQVLCRYDAEAIDKGQWAIQVAAGCTTKAPMDQGRNVGITDTLKCERRKSNEKRHNNPHHQGDLS